MDNSEEAFISPPPKAVPSKTVFLKPGEIVSKMQAYVLKRDRFVSVLGIEVVDSWKFNWDMLEDSAPPFDDINRISVINSLHTILLKRARKRKDSEFETLKSDFRKLLENITFVHIDRLEITVENYFNSLFPGSSIEYDDKADGVQMGTKANVTLLAGEKRIYHAKTHSAGRLASVNLGAKNVNPRELMIYKFLQHSGFGCETHFMQRSVEDVYIATLDAGHGGSFRTFGKATGAVGNTGDETYGRTLWGSLESIDPDSSLNDWNAIETAAQSDRVAQNFLQQMSSLDVLSRIFRLDDLLTNVGNFGFLETSAAAMPILKIFDFRVVDDYAYKVDSDHFKRFLAGNGLYNYVGSHRVMRYGLHDRPREQRVKAALQVLTTGPLARSHECVELAFEDVCRYINSTKIFADNVSQMIEKLCIFRDDLHYNLIYFTRRLQSWKPEKDE